VNVQTTETSTEPVFHMVSLLQAENTTQLLQQLTRILPVIVMTDHKILKGKNKQIKKLVV
jgi:hypothetical protein